MGNLSEFLHQGAVVVQELPSGFGDADADHPAVEGALVIRTEVFDELGRLGLQFGMLDAESEIRRRLVLLPPADAAVDVVHVQRCQTNLRISTSNVKTLIRHLSLATPTCHISPFSEINCDHFILSNFYPISIQFFIRFFNSISIQFL